MMKKAENATQAVKRGPYAKPTLTRFGDVRDVTLLNPSAKFNDDGTGDV